MRTLDPISAGLSPVTPVVFSRVRASILLPDLAITAALVTFFYVFFLFGGSTALFRDADAGWHLVAGEKMLATGSLPKTDPWSFSKPNAPWIAWEWGADVITGAIHRTAGLSGVAAFYGMAIACSVWMWFRLNWAVKGNFLIACALASPLLSTVNLHWLARPHILSWLFLLTTVHRCELSPPNRDRKGAEPKQLAAAVLLGATWANIHGSFFLGPIIFAIYAIGLWLKPVIWDEPSSTAKPLFITSAAMTAGTLLNPNGWNLHTHILGYLTNAPLLDRIGEFQTFNFHAEGATQIILALLIGIIGGVASLSARNPSRFLLALLLTATAIRSARMLPVAALLLLPLANGSITAALRSADLTSHFRKALDYGDNLRNLDARCAGLAAIPFAALLLFGASKLPAAFPSDQFPVKAATVIPAEARLFAPDKFGGYLIYRFAGERKVFFDGRSDFYGADFLKSYSRIVQVRPGWQEAFDKWNFSHALLPLDYSLVPALEARGWTEQYRDKTAVLLVAPMKGPRA